MQFDINNHFKYLWPDFIKYVSVFLQKTLLFWYMTVNFCQNIYINIFNVLAFFTQCNSFFFLNIRKFMICEFYCYCYYYLFLFYFLMNKYLHVYITRYTKFSVLTFDIYLFFEYDKYVFHPSSETPLYKNKILFWRNFFFQNYVCIIAIILYIFCYKKICAIQNTVTLAIAKGIC